MSVKNLSISYPDFKLNDVIDPEKFDINNSDIQIKVNEIVAKINKITGSTTDGDSGADNISLTQIDGYVSTTLQSLLEELDVALDGVKSDISNLSTNKTDKSGDHPGTWQGLTPGEASEAVNGARLDVLEPEVDTKATKLSSSDTAVFYVSPTGDDTNDGKTSSTPFKTLQKAFDTVESSYSVIDGTVKIDLASGTYEQSASISKARSKNRIQLIGKVDTNGVPTVIFDGVNDSTLPYAMMFSDYMGVFIQDIKVQNYANSSSRNGVVAQNYTNLYTKNVYVVNCGFAGINMNNFGRLYVEGGLLDQNRIGIRGYSNCVVTIGYNNATKSYTDANRTLITNSTESGVYLYNMSTGHLDYCELDSNNVGVSIQNSSRLHVMGCLIKNSVKEGVKVSVSSTWFNDGNTFQANAQDFAHQTNSVELNQESLKSSYYIKADSTAVTHTGTITRDVVKSVVIPKGTLSGNGVIRVKVFGQFSLTTGNTASVYCYFGGNNLYGFTSADASLNYFYGDWDLISSSSNSVVAHRTAKEANTDKTNGYVSYTIDPTIDNNLEVLIELTSSTDSVEIAGFLVEEVPV